MTKKPDPEQVVIHNRITQTTITGIIACEMGRCDCSAVVRAAAQIMELIERRGYEPQIRSFNQLKNGRHV